MSLFIYETFLENIVSNIPVNIITVDKSNVIVKLSFKNIILMTIEIIGTNNWIIPAVINCILGNTSYHNKYPIAEVKLPEINAKRIPFSLIKLFSGENKR